MKLFLKTIFLTLLAASCGQEIVVESHEGYSLLTQNGGPALGYASGADSLIIYADGHAFKDLNRNGGLDVYEDWRKTPAERAENLVKQMPVEYLSGILTNGHTVNVPGYASMSVSGILYNGKPFQESGAQSWAVCDKLIKAINDFDTRQILMAHSESPTTSARWNNEVQKLCEAAPFGIPSCNSSDPRNEIKATDEYNAGSGGVCSQWPTPLGLAATFDPAVVADFANTVKKEYRAIGFGTALSPQADLATDPRWRRNPGTFGEDPQLVADLSKAYIDAFQITDDKDLQIHEGWGHQSLNCMVKHWPAGGAGEGGRDAHISIGKYAVFPGNNLKLGMDTFKDGAFELDGPTGCAAAVMPYYTISWDQDPSGENVGNSYNKYIIDSLLRKQYGFEGIVCTDWGIVPDYNMDPLTTGGKCYGVEDQTIGERIFKILDAGVDQMGGSVNAGQIMQAYRIWTEKYGEQSARERWEASAKRILIGFFRIGLFENPYVDPENADKVLNDPELHAKGEEAQSKSVVMVKNAGGALPLDKKMKVYVPIRNIPGVYSMTGRQKKAPYVGYSVDTAEVAKRYTIVDTPEQADFAIVAITEPEGGIGYSKADVKAGGNGYLPISLQYSPYTATYARDKSIAGGDPAEKFTNRSYKGKSITVENQTDLALVRETKAAMGDKPVIVLLSTTRPVVMEFEPWADAILVAFGVRSAAYLDIVTGSKEPYGLLPMQFPIDMNTVEEQFEDTPHDMIPYLDACGNRYDFAFGMNWAGVIDDARVKKYKK